MEIRLYNSLTNKIEKFVPIHKNKISIYVCGPTVYNYQHIGNARPLVVFDVLRRFFIYLGYDVKFVSNLTDVDDKIINQALKENVSEKIIAEKYSKAYFKLMEDLNCLLPEVSPKVTENMDKIIEFIKELINLGYAYQINGNVYFKIDKLEKYGLLCNFDKTDLKVGSRIEANKEKENPLDFTLWKKTNIGIKWDSPWSKGRPGWHSECVVMIQENFNNEKIDIHGGGNDLKFPHHENEIAQSCALNKHTLANYWVHNGMVTIDDLKMSKSLGNFKWAKDLVLEHGANVIRLNLISTSYRSPLNFSDESLNSNKIELEKIFSALNQANLKMVIANYSRNQDFDKEQIEEFLKALADDLNTSNALSVLFETIKRLNVSLRENNLEKINIYYNTFLEENKILGLKYNEKNLTSEDRDLYFSWQELIKNKDYVSADELRQQLMDKGVI